MANVQNLRPLRLSHEEATENGRKGGLASAESRRRRKEMRELLNDYLDRESVPHLKEWMMSHGVEEEDCCNLMALLLAVFSKAMTGNVEAANAVLEWAGLLPLQEEREAAEIAKLKQSTTSEGAVFSNDAEPNDVIIYHV